MMSNQVCILTGAAGGIGQSIARLFDSQGMKLILQDRSEAKLEALNDSLKGDHRIISGDLSDAEVRKSLMQNAFSDQSQLPTMLINNAGISQFKAFSEVTASEIDTLFLINLTATIDFTRLFLEHVSTPSTIVNVGSTFGAIGYPGYTLYCASKFGIRGFTEALRREHANSVHRICYFAPRATNTAINSKNVQEMNTSLGNQCDVPDVVAKELLKLISSNESRRSVGWPEKFFARINGLLPEVVDKAIMKQTKDILSFAKGEH